MNKRNFAIQKIEFALAFIVTRVRLSNKLNFTDINIVAEDLFKSLLNLIYDYDLKNANAVKQNETAIDLYFNKEKIAYQITSQNKSTKIKDAVNSFIRGEKYSQYSKYFILTISEANKCNCNDLEKLRENNVQAEYLNISDLERHMFFNCETEKLEAIAEFLDYEVLGKDKKKPAYNSDIEKLKTLHIVDQIYTVLKRFEGFNCVHPRTISKLYPFNTSEKTSDSYSHYCLKTDNSDIQKVLQNVKVANNLIIINDDSLKSFEEKLKEIFLILNHSLIRCICYLEKYTEVEHHKINLLSFDVNCNCLDCQYHKFKVQQLFSILKEKSFANSTNLKEVLSESYYLCKLGEHLKGWQLFDNITKESKRQKKDIIYFLASYNITQIKRFIESPWWINEQKQILPKIAEIDLHDILCQLKLPLEVRNELIKIKEKNRLYYARAKVDEYYSQIVQVKKSYAKGDYHWGPPTVDFLWEELHILYAFYSSNKIIADDLYTFRGIITKGVDALLISYSTHERYEDKYKLIDDMILSFMIFYVDEEDLERMFEDNSIQELRLYQNERSAFLITIENFFTFQFKKGVLKDLRFNEDILKQDYFSHYRQLIRHIFNRVMLILSKIEITDEELKPLTEPIINYLSIAEDLHHNNWNYALKFFEQRIQIFSTEEIKILIELIIDERRHTTLDTTFKNFCIIVNDKIDFVLSADDFFKRLIDNVTRPCKKCKGIHNTQQLLACWKIADDSSKKIIKEIALEYLEKKFDPDFYEVAVFEDVFSKDETHLLQQFISYANSACSAYDVKEEKGILIPQSFNGLNSINCLAYLDVDFKQENVQTISQKSEYYNWMINYEVYDYSSFNVKWLTQFCPYYIRIKLRSAKGLKERVIEELKWNYDSELAKLFIEYLN